MNGLLDVLSDLIGKSGWLAPLLALAAGIVASFLPCSLSTVPLIVGYVGGTGQRDPKKAFLLSVVFAAGSAVTFTALGAAASMAGRLVGASSSWWYIVLGALMVLMALQMWEVFEFIPASYLVSKSGRRGFAGAFLAGVLSGIFSSPCSTPVLIVVLAAVAGRGNVLWGIVLLLFYSVGHGMLAVLAGTSVGFVKKLSGSGGYGKLSAVLKYVMGALILLLGLYMLYLGF
ncbi:cytochrome c biogenesis protein CcdA [Papillibacter cinnamivorans]|uniref:Cytochrome C biogenesis protein transmembrane region n=1 Tax=Papillibacter cinnamivorans DSM 12816 TaxID=1122930 RepID=A0A1W2BBG0_9FIRM|nr:cytochrome c biogenesis protein CcdA [Papillibacter cinnamivorans]SMC70239.1 Cytochrome C biogenesis protein transmembrane region [Papillibacter cinnamivorans DSM 12816]